MKEATHHGNDLPNKCGILYITHMPLFKQLIEIFNDISLCNIGTILVSKLSNCKDIQNRFKKEGQHFVRTLDLQTTIRYGAALYIIAAMVAMPAQMGSASYQGPRYEVPLVAQTISSEILNPSILWDHSNSYLAASAQIEDIPYLAPVPKAPPFHSHILRASQTYEVDSTLIRAIIMAESSNNPRAVSRRGAKGLMQLMPTTAKWLGVADAFDPALNIDGGVRYFKRLLDRFNGDTKLALAAYNAGSRYVRKYDGVPPFKATRTYIKKVLHYQLKYQEEMAQSASGLTMS